MTAKRYALIESVDGSGEVFKDGNQIATVDYNLRTRQEIIQSETGDTAGRLLIDGVVIMKSGEPDLFGLGPLVLRTEDHREVTFLPLFGTAASGSFQIKVSGNFRTTGN